MTPASDSADWDQLFAEIGRRFRQPRKQSAFVIYFFGANVVLGCIGIWVELAKYLYAVTGEAGTSVSLDAFKSALITFFPAMTGGACMQLVLAVDHKGLKAVASTVLVLSLCAAVLLGTAIRSDWWVICGAIVGAVVALCTWWVANADQPDLKEIYRDAAIGANVDQPLKGSLDGFST